MSLEIRENKEMYLDLSKIEDPAIGVIYCHKI